MKNLIILVAFAFIEISYSQIQTDTLFTIKGQPISFTIAAEGMVLSHITEYRDPFYHASGLFNSLLTTNIGKNVKIPLRFVAEVWSFSDKYQDNKNLFTWAKPSIQARITQIKILDSIVLNVGDLWRQKQGQGLILDYFESQGGEARFYKNKFYLSARDLGYGLTGPDDIATFSIGYDSSLSFNHFINYFILEGNLNDIHITSVDSYTRINEHFQIYEEAAINLRTYAKGFLAGVIIKYFKNKNFVDAKIELRYYDKDFYSKQKFYSPYFESLTALDKPINQFYTYLIRNKVSRVLAGRIKARWFPLDGFFMGADLEPMVGDINKFAYETTIGFEPEENVLLKAGIMNKFFNLYERGYIFDLTYLIPNRDMFTIEDKPFLFAKASFQF